MALENGRGWAAVEFILNCGACERPVVAPLRGSCGASLPGHIARSPACVPSCGQPHLTATPSPRPGFSRGGRHYERKDGTPDASTTPASRLDGRDDDVPG